MSFSRRSFLAAVVLLLAAAGTAVAAPARSRPDPIVITAPASAPAGTTVCVTVSVGSGTPAVRVEQGDDALKVSVRSTEQGVVYCFDIPPGTAGRDVVVTAVDAEGNIVVKSIRVT